VEKQVEQKREGETGREEEREKQMERNREGETGREKERGRNR
jgi:hypothetical protein